MIWTPKVSDRVEYSVQGLERLNPRTGQRRGTVAGSGGGPDCVGVVWDGLKYSQSYNTEFLQRAPAGALEPSVSPAHQKMIALHGEGKTTKEIGDIVGRDPRGVGNVLRKAGLKPHRGARHIITRSPWSPRRCADLTRLWQRGLSASRIAQLIQCTRNAVIGKAHRMNLPSRASPIRRAA